MNYIVYILECSDGSLYTGITTDVERRLKEHNGKLQKGAAYTRSRRPVKLRYTEECSTRGEAQSREMQIKQFSREEKFQLISSSG